MKKIKGEVYLFNSEFVRFFYVMKSLSFVFFLAFCNSCTSQVNDPTKLKLKEIKNEIVNYLDSSNYYFDKIISDHENGVDNSTINKKYNRKLEIFETKISQAIEKVNVLGRKGKLTEHQFEAWINDIELTKASNKSKLIRELNIDLEDLPITNNYELTQKHVDSTHHFSIRFPKNWMVFDDYMDFTLMATGAIVDTTSGTSKHCGFGVSAKSLNKEYSTLAYYKDNLMTIKNKLSDFELIEEKTISLNGIESRYVVFSGTAKNGQDSTMLQIFLVKDKKGYVLGGGTRTIEFEKFRDLFIEISRTFKLDKS